MLEKLTAMQDSLSQRCLKSSLSGPVENVVFDDEPAAGPWPQKIVGKALVRQRNFYMPKLMVTLYFVHCFGVLLLDS